MPLSLQQYVQSEGTVAITELRRLTFDRDSIVDAIARVPENAFALRITPESVYCIDFKPDQQAISIASGRPETDGLVVSADSLETLLIAYCRTLRIPIPRKGEKLFEIEADRATLTIVIRNPASSKVSVATAPWSLGSRIA